MTPQQVLPVLIPMLVVGLIVLKSRGAPRTLRPQFMWVMPAVVLPLIGMGLFFTPHQPFGPVAWLAFAAALALGAAFGWWRGKMVTIQKTPDGVLKAKASPLGVIVLVALLAGRTVLRGFLETHAAGWHVDAAVFTDAFLLFAVGLIVAQRLEMYIRARRVMAGEPDSHLAAVALHRSA